MKNLYNRLKDDKDRCEDCPVVVEIRDTGSLHVNSNALANCCKFKKQVEASNRLSENIHE